MVLFVSSPNKLILDPLTPQRTTPPLSLSVFTLITVSQAKHVHEQGTSKWKVLTKKAYETTKLLKVRSFLVFKTDKNNTLCALPYREL